MFRVYNTKDKKWESKEFCISSRGDLFQIKRTIFGNDKFVLAPGHKYVINNVTGVVDKNGRYICEGDICSLDTDGGVLAVVGYVKERAAYFLFDDSRSVYYDISQQHQDKIEVVGNVYDDPHLICREETNGNSSE